MATVPVRYGSMIRVRPEKLAEYKELHANPWPEVLEQISRSNIRNYSIYYKDGLLFGYYEYWGDDYAADMAKMAADPMTQKWWERTDPCQEPLETRAEGEWWARMEEVFYWEGGSRPYAESVVPTPGARAEATSGIVKPRRSGTVIRVKPEKLDEYKELHANPWPEITAAITARNIRNYSIYYKDGYLFSYNEYWGDDYEADMAKNRGNPIALKWRDLTSACHIPLETRAEGEWWAKMEEVFHWD
jgi:L-rhamnose mutarotase